ncbi:uncharacterized protein LOC132184734 isoform X2 [Corylus avellana]|uniref:uncharacterized protein LOC132184734 isoform X2 n=1 Tax=Corylus avellana TaxID=13451 RepID=UPI00286C6B35|nr:uncharacterized protein LOC132184734 isoform X2 [Corylus avellana]
MNPNAPDPFQTMLKESVHRFLAEYRKGATDFSNFGSIFSRLLQNLPDPPLEFVWFYSALTFHSAKLTGTAQDDSSKRVSVVKELFQLLVSCSSPCGEPKRIAMLAPVICELYCLVLDKKSLNPEVESLLEGLVCYSSICCGAGLEEEDAGFAGSGFSDVLHAWTVDKIGIGDELRVVFPMVSDGVRKAIRMGCGVGYLAGVVMCEALLLRLCFKFWLGSGSSRMELEKDVRDSAIHMINGFRSFWFLGESYSCLLEILSSEDEALLQEVLHDVVIRLGYPFLEPPRGIQLAEKHLKNLILTWLLVVDTAIHSVREKGNQARAFSYINAFSESCLPSQLIKWVSIQTITRQKISKPDASTPVTLLRWLLILEEQGVRVFDCDILKLQVKAVICKSKVECVLPELKPEGKNLDEKPRFSSSEDVREEDKFDGDVEMTDSVETALLRADGMMKTTATNGTRKRKEGTQDEEEPYFKFVKNHFHESSVREKCSCMGKDDGFNRSEMDNSVSVKIWKM